MQKSQRSVLKKIYQKDGNAGNCMIVFVAFVSCENPEEFSIVICDGWYAIHAVPDAPLRDSMSLFHSRNKLVGSKLIVWNAFLHNCSGIDPLEAVVSSATVDSFQFDKKRDAHLGLHANSTRIGSWELKLGQEIPPRNPSISSLLLSSLPISSLKMNGGIVRSIRGIVFRVSPVLYLRPKDCSGPRVFSEKQHSEWIQNEMSKKRKVTDECTPFIRLKLICSHYFKTKKMHISERICASISIWRPKEEYLSLLKEGNDVYCTNLAVTWMSQGNNNISSKEERIRMSSTKQTSFEVIPHSKVALRTLHQWTNYSNRECITIKKATDMLQSSHVIDDVEMCVIILEVTQSSIGPPPATSKTRQQFDNGVCQFIFSTDLSLRLLTFKVPFNNSGKTRSTPRKDWKVRALVSYAFYN